MTNSKMSPAEIVDQYTEQVYHRRDLTSLDTLLADPMIRHEPDGTRLALTIEEAKLRITSFHRQFRSMSFTNRKIIQDQESVATAYEADLVSEDGEVSTICGIEIFTVRNGRITEVWNAPAGNGSWG
ncbi:MAG: nuclear transport factor 2 family protein [Acidimicrobiales bacterium]|nr:nuclear transport factor 2 family protein [Acidimicrobiales bacterium]MDP6901892.1 nuclear transport factor 2 family protein [Acidimicrobiales bacterium]HJL99650.1 nuclear transport factor 2 family protein [Acidimicrobiales bacterium]